ncbi:MAG: UDP-N-acetylmuramoyl-tripeptide--D-alanyl-D-alanine ligase [Proteocatella sp.]
MENISIKKILEMTNGTLNFEIDENLIIENISHDSRQIKENSLYVAINGENLDGHRFVDSALKNGAIAAIVEKPTSGRDILVDDCYVAIKRIAMAYKDMFDIPIVSVTGSSGKTTTKDMLYYAISKSCNTLRNLGNLNTEIGLPMTIYNLNKEHQCAILEMGMYELGEIDYLAEIARPNIAVITNVGVAHMQSVGSRENILKAKMEISNYMTAKDILIINGDNDMLKTVDKNAYKFKIYTFGIEEGNDFRMTSYNVLQNSMKIKASMLGEELEYTIPTLGIHNIYNSLSVLGVCKVMGLDMDKSIQGIAEYQPSKYRMEIKQLGDKTVVEDFYNANPDSMKASIETFKDIDGSRRVAILADMLELGGISQESHRMIGKIAGDIFDVIICIGQEASYIGQEAQRLGFASINIHCFDKNKEAIEKINSILKPGDTILIKGSRGMKLEEVAESIC